MSTVLIRHNALKSLVSPSAPFRPPSKDADADGEGAWSELPLYDGREWDAEACALAPTLSRLLQTADGRALPELRRAARLRGASKSLRDARSSRRYCVSRRARTYCRIVASRIGA